MRMIEPIGTNLSYVSMLYALRRFLRLRWAKQQAARARCHGSAIVVTSDPFRTKFSHRITWASAEPQTALISAAFIVMIAFLEIDMPSLSDVTGERKRVIQ